MSKKLNVLVVLCPGEPRNGRFDDLEKRDDGEFLYLGGETRMVAGTLEAKKEEYKKVLVVGGSKNKVDNMKNYLIDRGIEGDKIIRVESDPDTQGNLYALRKVMEESKRLNINILTNQYHEPRTRLMAKDILGQISKSEISWEIIAAEDILSRVVDKVPTGVFKKEKLARNYKEAIGCFCWDNKVYYKQNKTNTSEWTAIIRDPDVWEEFLKNSGSKEIVLRSGKPQSST